MNDINEGPAWDLNPNLSLERQTLSTELTRLTGKKRKERDRVKENGGEERKPGQQRKGKNGDRG